MARDHHYYVYILASGHYGTLYVGMTNDLGRRVSEHQISEGGAFTRRYKINQLVYFELHYDVNEAIQREKSLKRWPRAWKTNLIERDNPNWIDLLPALLGLHAE